MHSPRQQLHVLFLPELAPSEFLAGKTVVVADILRATTTIVHALAAGAQCVIPCREVEEALRLKQTFPEALLGGEREGKQIPGFDFGNSPAAYTAAAVAGKTILFTTTNGTRAMEFCRQAKCVLLGAFVNLSAIFRSVQEDREIAVICSGTNGGITREDVLFAGALVRKLEQINPEIRMNDEARLAAEAWMHCAESGNELNLAKQLEQTQGGRNLIRLGFQTDIALAANIDRFEIAPRLDLKRGRIVLPE